MDEIVERLETAARNLIDLGPAVEAGEPWPLSDAYGAEPEADWGPKELLAHLAEMAPYWLSQIELVLAGDAEPVPFGRVATDPDRIGRIGQDRLLPAAALVARIEDSVAAAATRLRTLGPAEAARRGTHNRLGEMTVDAIVVRFIVSHLEDHVDQLRGILAERSRLAT
jgi:hypothetical protein